MKNYKKLEAKIFAQLKKDCPNIETNREVDYKYGEGDNLVEMVRGVQVAGLINFYLEDRANSGENWLEINYYSKIEKTVIFDYDVAEVYDDLFSFAKQLAEYQERIDEQESKTFCLYSEDIELIQGAISLAIEHDQDVLDEGGINMLENDANEYRKLIKQYEKLSKRFNRK